MEVKYNIGDSTEVLKQLEDKSVDCCITSPPYWGLRDYGNEKQLGLEPTPEEYVNNLCDVFDEVHRVLKDDGTLWLNLGDSYASGKSRYSTTPQGNFEKGKDRTGKYGELVDGKKRTCVKNHSVLKDKDLVGIPWRVAFELQRRGWYLRQDIIWAKPNPMPESVKDRCTKSHEHIFLLSKSPKYYFDVEIIKEDGVIKKGTKYAKGSKERYEMDKVNSRPPEYKVADGKRRKRDVWTTTVKPFKQAHFATFPPDLIEPCVLAGCPEGGTTLDPFGGAGTTALVSKKHNRNSIYIDCNPDYLEIAKKRLGEESKEDIEYRKALDKLYEGGGYRNPITGSPE